MKQSKDNLNLGLPHSYPGSGISQRGETESDLLMWGVTGCHHWTLVQQLTLTSPGETCVIIPSQWCSQVYLPDQPIESIWTAATPGCSTCTLTFLCPPTKMSSDSQEVSSLCLCVVDCVAVSKKGPWSPAKATWWPSHLTRTRPTLTRVSPQSTKPLSQLTVRLIHFSRVKKTTRIMYVLTQLQILASAWGILPVFRLILFFLTVCVQCLFDVLDQLVPEGSSAPTTCASTRLCSVTAGTTVETAVTRTTAVSPTRWLWAHIFLKCNRRYSNLTKSNLVHPNFLPHLTFFCWKYSLEHHM